MTGTARPRDVASGLLDAVPAAARADEAEATLLGCILNWPRACLAVAARHVGPDDFLDPARQRLFGFLLALDERTQGRFDLPLVKAELAREGALEAVGDVDELIGLADEATTPETAELHAKAVHEAAVTRRLRDFCLNTLRDTGRADFRPADVLGTMEQRLARLAQGNGHAGAVTICLADVEPEAVRWLWPQRLALGKVSILVGDPNLGKSFITLDVAARVSRGMAWPDKAPGAGAGGVVILSAEDGLADTIRPRLDAAGADVKRITALEAVQVPGGDGSRQEPVNLSADLDALGEAIRGVEDCRLVIIDPITAYLGDADSHKNAEIRAVLAPLARLAADHGVAVLAVSHLRKSGGRAIYRTMGSLAFNAAARAVWAAAKAKDDPTGRRRLLLPVKNNLAADQKGMAYELGPGLNGGTVVRWEPDPVQVDADEVLADPRDGAPGPDADARDEAEAWLREALADGPLPSKDMRRMAEAAGHAWGTVKRVKKALGVRAEKKGFGSDATWYWTLPEQRRSSDCEGAQPQDENRPF